MGREKGDVRRKIVEEQRDVGKTNKQMSVGAIRKDESCGAEVNLGDYNCKIISASAYPNGPFCASTVFLMLERQSSLNFPR